MRLAAQEDLEDLKVLFTESTEHANQVGHIDRPKAFDDEYFTPFIEAVIGQFVTAYNRGGGLVWEFTYWGTSTIHVRRRQLELGGIEHEKVHHLGEHPDYRRGRVLGLGRYTVARPSWAWYAFIASAIVLFLMGILARNKG